MNSGLRPGAKGEPLPENVFVIRLGKPSTDALALQKAHESHFALSTADEQSELQSLSVWARDLTSAAQARELMGENKAAYQLALHLNVDDIRAIHVKTIQMLVALDVVWDPDPRPNAEGHAGIIGLKRPPGGDRSTYKTLRAKLTQIALVQILA